MISTLSRAETRGVTYKSELDSESGVIPDLMTHLWNRYELLLFDLD